ncbi:hypothetical protein BDW62DRAFT_20937 [Aspergillus aurantiobrunneus]
MSLLDQVSNMSSSSSAASTTTTTAGSPSTATSSSAAQTHTIQVGPKEDPHQYVPHSLEAKVGDLIVFEFYPRNHSVVQADWRAPCMPADGDYFFSGIKNDFEEVNGQVVGTLPTWNWTVDRDEPTFFYCTSIDSCNVNGMVGVINPNETSTWNSQNRAALNAPYMLFPGQSMPAEGETSGSGTTATHSSPSSTSSSTANPPGQSSSSSSQTLSAGAIAGIVIGSVAFVIILCVLLFLLGRNHVYKKWLWQSHEANSSKEARTAQWALSTSAAGIGAAKSEGDAGRTSFPGHMSIPAGASPLNEPGSGIGPGPVLVPGTGPGPGTGFMAMEHNLPRTQSGLYSAPEGEYGMSAPSLGPQMQGQQSPQVHPGQQQQPYWIWDQSIQPYQSGGRRGGPSELEGDVSK